ncbi:MAG: hypothetical protein ACE365_03950 [Gammaproteobacteria bacterium]
MEKSRWFKKGFVVFLRRHYHFIAQGFLGYPEGDQETVAQHPLLEKSPPRMKDIHGLEWLTLPLWPAIYGLTFIFVVGVNSWESGRTTFAIFSYVPDAFLKLGIIDAKSLEEAKNLKRSLFQTLLGIAGIFIGCALGLARSAFVGGIYLAALGVMYCASYIDSFAHKFWEGMVEAERLACGEKKSGGRMLDDYKAPKGEKNFLGYIAGLVSGVIIQFFRHSDISTGYVKYTLLGRALHRRFKGQTLSCDTNESRTTFGRFLGVFGLFRLSLLLTIGRSAFIFLVRKGVIAPVVKFFFTPLMLLGKGISKLYKTIFKKRRFDEVNEIFSSVDACDDKGENDAQHEEEPERDLVVLRQTFNAQTKQIVRKFKILYESLNSFGELRGHRKKDSAGNYVKDGNQEYIYQISRFHKDKPTGEQRLGAFFILAMNFNQQTPTKILLDEVWKAFESEVLHDEKQMNTCAHPVSDDDSWGLEQPYPHATIDFFDPNQSDLFNSAIQKAKRRCGINVDSDAEPDFAYQFAIKKQKDAYNLEIDVAVRHVMKFMNEDDRIIDTHPLDLEKPSWSPGAFFRERYADCVRMEAGKEKAMEGVDELKDEEDESIPQRFLKLTFGRYDTYHNHFTHVPEDDEEYLGDQKKSLSRG